MLLLLAFVAFCVAAALFAVARSWAWAAAMVGVALLVLDLHGPISIG